MAPPQQQLTTATLDPVPARQVDDVPVAEEMSDSFLAYALSVITSRAIPDVRDGLKPVQRRVLYSMLQMGLRPGTPYRKSARVVGDTMGRYHPHGDAAIYDTLVRMGQNFSRMVALVDPQGNFGSLDDPPAAARYTECRLSGAAMDMVGELDEDTVDFRPTYDGEDTEPVVLPAALPNLLVNGTAGIAVGMATNMLPHNLAEVGEAIELVMSRQPGEAAAEPSRRRRARPTTDELMDVVPGPDFPGGGIVVTDDGLRAAYDCGRGSVRVRARASIESITRRRQAVIVTELPHLVGPERVVSRITELVGAGRLTGVSGIADLSDMDGLRLQIDLKPGSDPSTVLGELYRHTPLEEGLSVNNVVLVDGVPTTVGLRELCEHYVAHRLQVVVRRTRHRLRRADERLHIVEGLIAALDNIDDVVALIRGSRDATEARAGLMGRFGLTEVQATHILDMALRRLTALEREKLDAEAETLRADISDFKEILASNRRQRAIVRKELRRIVDDHGRPRRSRIVTADQAERELAEHAGDGAASAAAPDSADLGPDLPCVVTVSTSGHIGRASLKGDRRASPGRHDLIAASVVASTRTPVVAVTSAGRAFSALGAKIPEANNRVRGADVSSVLDLDAGEQVLALVAAGSDRLVMVTASGGIKRIEADEVLGVAPGASLVSLGSGDRLACAFTAPDDVDLVLAADDGRALRMAASSVRVQRRGAAGMAGIKLRNGSVLVGAGAVIGDPVLTVATSTTGDGSGVKATYCSELPTQGRGGQGVLVVKLQPGESVVAAAVGAVDGMLALMGQDDNPRKIDPHPVPIRIEPTARYRSPQRLERRIHVLAPGRW
ncbi:MAG: DNA topoisomerase 4 subunit A [Acidimicrobiaceae bacterium]|nr:DNA topoisomerase 4 subunit A [Acidimicrobiaceae bacterium]MYI34882.1 DNA topoisomerase 4 subunit A [Acidimicrobiaceae bacterium]